MGLRTYEQKRDFRRTPEPRGGRGDATARAYVVQKHDASRLHYDLRLALDGVLKSWAVPKGPSLDPDKQVLAVEVEDHPLDYRDFEGVIPKHQYGGGTVMVWDVGTWEPLDDPHKGLQRGKLKFTLHGEKLRGDWVLVRMNGKDKGGKRNWLLRKLDDDEASTDDVLNQDRSVLTGRGLAQIAARAERVWDARAGEKAGAAPLADLPGAKQASMPRTFAPQLATLVNAPPRGDDWLHEIKFDGYRLLARVARGKVHLITRGNQDWTRRFPTIADAVAALPVDRAILDGEVVAESTAGMVRFQTLQNHLQRGDQANLVLYLFDVPYLDGYDLTNVPLIERKTVLARLLANTSGGVRYSDHIRGDGDAVVEQACRKQLEGIISKRADAKYRQARSRDWVKSKCIQRQEFAVVGYTDPGGARTGFGSLLLATHAGDGWQYRGKVGSGFDETSLHDLHKQLKALATKPTPVKNIPAAEKRGAHWVEPKLVAEVRFTEWTGDGRLRHPVFVGLREDKSAMNVTKEKEKPVEEVESKRERKRKSKSDVTVADVRISSPDRVVFPEQGVTKLALAEYYHDIADWILPHVVNRPLALVRCPEGREGACFFQKHVSSAMPDAVKTVGVAEQGKNEAPHVQITDEAGLIGLVQAGVLEIHTWGCRSDRIERPDRLVFDLDPGPGVGWPDVVQATRELKDVLDTLELQSFVKLSGGKGVHVEAPLDRRNTWDDVKPFAKLVARFMQQRDPKRYIAVMTRSKRKGKIFVDYLRNGRGATAVAAYSTRARKGAPVAAPIRWGELSDDLPPNAFNVTNIRQRLAQLQRDPWHGYDKVRQSITKTRHAALNAILKQKRTADERR